MLDSRANDGSAQANEPAYTYTVAPGVYQPTPPFTTGFLTGWGRVKPFVLTSASQFRPPPLYSLTSAQYTADFNETKSLGSATSTTRTAEQSQIAKFWLEDTSQSWALIAATLSPARHLDGWAQARLYAVLEAAQSDGFVAGIEAKYHYNFWRPITAIREADTDGNGATVADPDWVSFDPVAPPVPDYPSTHSTSAGAGAAVLQATMGDTIDLKYSSNSLPGVVRHYTSVAQIADEIGASRIYVGYHFRNAVTQGLITGKSVGAYVEARTMRRQ